MILNIILIIFVLITGTLVSSLIFWILLNRRIKFYEAVKLVSVAATLNKLFLSGSGYATMSLKLKKDNFKLHECLLSFAAVEFFSIIPWIIIGLYFGARIFIRISYFSIIFLGLIVIFAIYKRNKILEFFKQILGYFKYIKKNILIVIFLALVNVVLGVYYYFFLFKVFNLNFALLDVLKIASVAFTVGYLSPIPAGLGFKESSLIFLLMEHGITLKASFLIAIADRIMLTGVCIILGLLFGTKMLIEALKISPLSKNIPKLNNKNEPNY
ncbi:MAG: lysylphosphatidylglycerol synthase domain-containing protein [Candidatus Omnitrophota bacterium]